MRVRHLRLRSSDGFTLIEVLVAAVISALVLLGLAVLQGLSIETNKLASERSQAAYLAADLAERLRANFAVAENLYDRNINYGAHIMGSPPPTINACGGDTLNFTPHVGSLISASPTYEDAGLFCCPGNPCDADATAPLATFNTQADTIAASDMTNWLAELQANLPEADGAAIPVVAGNTLAANGAVGPGYANPSTSTGLSFLDNEENTFLIIVQWNRNSGRQRFNPTSGTYEPVDPPTVTLRVRL